MSVLTDRRGFFGIGIYHNKSAVNIGTLWRSAFVYEASFIFTVGRRYKKQASDTLKSWRHVPLYNYEDFNDLKEHLPYATRIVCIEISPNAADLNKFSHPERCVYLLGAEDQGLPSDLLEKYYTVRVASRRCLNVSVAGSIVMYDRYVKRGHRNVM